VDNTTIIGGANLPIGGLSAHHHCLCAFHKITQTLRKFMARNRLTRQQRAVGYTILAKVHGVLRSSETEEELNHRLAELHRAIKGNYIEPDSRYLETRILTVSKKAKPKKKSRADNTLRGSTPSVARSPVGVGPQGVPKLDEASPAIAQNLQGPKYEIQSFCGYDEGAQEIRLVWEGTDGVEAQECAFELHSDLGEVVFERLCQDAGIDLSLVKRTAGIGASSVGVEVRCLPILTRLGCMDTATGPGASAHAPNYIARPHPP